MDVATSLLGHARPARLLPTRLVMPAPPHPGRRLRPRPSGPSRRSSRVARRGARRAGPDRFHTSAARLGFEPWSTTGSGVPTDGKRLWEKLGDDRDLIGVKIALLAALLILTAVLEWVA